MRPLTSRQNPKFRAWLELLTSRGSKEQNRFLLSGRKIVPEVLANKQADIEAILIREGDEALLKTPSTLDVYSLPKALFQELDELGTDFPLLVLRIPDVPEFDFAPTPQGLEVLCALGDPANVGALARAAKAFDAQKLILLKESAWPFLPKAVKASAGAVLGMNLAKGPSLKTLAGNLSWQTNLIALDQGGEDIATFRWPKNCRLLIGEEGQGVPETLHCTRVTIPMNPGVESLNAVSAGSIALFLKRLSDATH